MTDYVTLDTLARGAAVERFEDQLKNVLENILDPNTAPTASRSVTLTVKIKPTDSREVGNVEILCTAKLAPPKPVSTVIFFGRESNGQIVAMEKDAKQTEIEFQQPKIIHGRVANGQ